MENPIRLLILLSDDSSERMDLPLVSDTVEELIEQVKEACKLTGGIRLQYKDVDFGGTFVNLSSTSSIKDLTTIKVIPSVPDTDIILEFIDSVPSDLSDLDSSSFSAHTDSDDTINAEFLRVTAVPLLTRFMAQLDKYSTQLLKIIRKKGGATKAKTATILEFLDQEADADVRRECVLKSLIIYLGECVEDLIKEYTMSQKDQAEQEL
ncbi:hypothetical protein N1851_001768 [Merluccius polli]|uniref:Uncharacterized protein n=1 Tax=Merluccius polli TaxID=89951 RepID=A0AA47NCK6_MERPO|nr:hypothetical protein N1851_001768 [Merluccius polli]